MMRPIRMLAMLAALATDVPAGAQDGGCLWCTDQVNQQSARPLTVEIESGLEFSRMAMVGTMGGQAEIDAVSGARRMDGGMLSLGGLAFRGRARIMGEPNRTVRIDLPPRVLMRSPEGGTIELTGFTTDLLAMPVLDGNGTLDFAFGGTLVASGNGGGNFRGRIPIRVDYD